MISDREILRLLKKSDKIAFNSLYEKYASLLYGRIRGLTDDISIACKLLEQSFIDIWRNVELYDPAKTTLFTWMLEITMKNCRAVFQSPSKPTKTLTQA